MHNRLFCALVVMFTATPSFVSGEVVYHVTNLGLLPDNNGYSLAYAVNNFGQITGSSGERGFLWTPITPNGTSGVMTEITGVAGNPSTYGVSINDFGQVVGTSSGSGDSHAFLWTPNSAHGASGTTTSLGDLSGGTGYSVADGINSYGQVTGQSTNGANTRAFLWNPLSPNATAGAMTDIGDLPGGSATSIGQGINDYGQIVGFGSTASGSRASLWTPGSSNSTTGTMIDLGLSNNQANSSDATDVSMTGAVIGYSILGNVHYPFIWIPTTPMGTSGTMTPIMDLYGGQGTTTPQDINALNEVVGLTRPLSASDNVPFVWSASSGMRDLNTLLDSTGSQWKLTHAMGINDVGQIVGMGSYDADGPGGQAAVTRAFLLTPVPEPSGALALIGVMAGLRLQRRRRVRKVSAVTSIDRDQLLRLI